MEIMNMILTARGNCNNDSDDNDEYSDEGGSTPRDGCQLPGFRFHHFVLGDVLNRLQHNVYINMVFDDSCLIFYDDFVCLFINHSHLCERPPCALDRHLALVEMVSI